MATSATLQNLWSAIRYYHICQCCCPTPSVLINWVTILPNIPWAIIFMSGSKCPECIYVAAFLTFSRKQYLRLFFSPHSSDIQQHRTLVLSSDGTPPPPGPPSLFSSWAQRDGACRSCHSPAVSLPQQLSSPVPSLRQPTGSS